MLEEHGHQEAPVTPVAVEVRGQSSRARRRATASLRGSVKRAVSRNAAAVHRALDTSSSTGAPRDDPSAPTMPLAGCRDVHRHRRVVRARRARAASLSTPPIEISPRRPLSPGARIDVYLAVREGSLRDGSLRHRVIHAVLMIPQVGFRYDLGTHYEPGGCGGASDEPGEFRFGCQDDTSARRGSARVEGDALIIRLDEQFEGAPSRAHQWRLALPARARVVFHGGQRSLGTSDAD